MQRPLLGQGYLGSDGAPDGLALTPPPPAAGSPAALADARAEAAALALRGSPRWDLARKDADLRSPAATSTFSCAAGRVINADATPRTDALLRRTLSDLARVSATAKQHYGRRRPFEGNGQTICTPDDEAGLRGNASYPSGHATIGTGWALILADLLPARRAVLLARGAAFADSRRVCNVHFASDVAAGRALAMPVVQRLRTDPVFRADLAAAKAELRKATPILPDCAAENAALAFRPKDAR
ncbi:MAG: phosphatase PAP2 family protein [Novosphingobium sp.]|nr:phosphatase PAP2 family protein [Novosphingobium sp.]